MVRWDNECLCSSAPYLSSRTKSEGLSTFFEEGQSHRLILIQAVLPWLLVMAEAGSLPKWQHPCAARRTALGRGCLNSQGWNWRTTAPCCRFIFVVALLQSSQGFDLLGQTFALTSEVIIALSVAQPREFIV